MFLGRSFMRHMWYHDSSLWACLTYEEESAKTYCRKKSRQSNKPMPAVDSISIWTVHDGPSAAGGDNVSEDIRMHGLSPRSHQSVDFNPGSLHLNGADFDPTLDPEAVEPQPQQDDIKVEYHPHNSCFTKHFVFDAQCLYKYNGARFTCFFDEPWTVNTFWDAQLQLPPDAKPLAFILYAAKNKLSSFGTQKGYLIIAQIANLPVEIRNGVGVAGGQVVGWLPIVNKNQKDSGKASFVNFKNATGYWFDCGDLIRHLLWSIILILSADYEEQCIMSLIHGLKGKFSCPVCLVPQDMQSIYTEELTLRTSAESQQVLKTARLAKTKKARENHLKAFLLCDVENIFWRVHHCDIHRALSWDRMHANNGRLWSDHLWVELQFWIMDLGREAAVQIDSNFDAFPRWPDVQHFSRVMKIDFTDSTTHEDISKTNFKNVATQIIHYDHWLLTSTSMCSEINDLDEYTRQQVVDPEAGEEIEEVAMHTYLGVRQGSQCYALK
ncbi:hypothetical protein C8R48DRAFT_770378 [Suillus tomentosus]|nr:hypothetical protein C8R48DRAFT_770378 [Suillus tomentosus]